MSKSFFFHLLSFIFYQIKLKYCLTFKNDSLGYKQRIIQSKIFISHLICFKVIQSKLSYISGYNIVVIDFHSN